VARLTKNQLTDKSRYQFRTVEVELPELGGTEDDPATVAVKTLTIAARNALPRMSEPLLDKNGKVVLNDLGNPVMVPNPDVDDLAQTWVSVVSDPQLSLEEAKAFLGDLPATAFDSVMAKFEELLGSKDNPKSDPGTSGAGVPSTEDGSPVQVRTGDAPE
jgi:hypothetical protein